MTKMLDFRLGVWQDETPAGGIGAALARIAQALDEAKDNKVDLLVFPECFLTGYFRAEADVYDIAETVTDDVLHTLQQIASDTGVAFVLGTYEPRATGVANTAHVFLPNVPLQHSYRKRALYGDWEKAAFEKGDAPCLFDYGGHRFAVLICFDVEFPELAREAAKAGADAILVPTALMAPDHWVADFVVPSRAIENGITVAYANRIGVEGHLTFIGKSQICDPLAQHRKLAPAEFQGLLHVQLTKPTLPADYIAEIKAQSLPELR